MGLAYNRFRYYDPEQGNYISQDPIGLKGNNPILYGYVYDSNTQVDPIGISVESRSLDVIVRTGKEVNAEFPADWSPPYKQNSKVTEFTTSKTETFVRVYTEGVTKKEGGWLMNESEGLVQSRLRLSTAYHIYQHT